jgi:monothiol glutaredoxin
LAFFTFDDGSRKAISLKETVNARNVMIGIDTNNELIDLTDMLSDEKCRYTAGIQFLDPDEQIHFHGTILTSLNFIRPLNVPPPITQFKEGRMKLVNFIQIFFMFFRRFISSSIKSKLQNIVSSSPVVVFMKGTKDAPQCGFSRAVVQILNLQGLHKFTTIDVLTDNEIREGIKEFSAWPTIPQLYLNGEFVGGCDIIVDMHQSGDLEKMLVDAKLIEAEK